MLAAPCIPPATGSVFSCILSCSKGVVHTLRLDATMFRLVSGRWSGGCRMGAYLLLYNMCCENVKWGWRDWGDGPSAPGIPLRSRCARPRPPYAEAKGDGVGSCLRKWWRIGGLARPRPGHTPRARFARSRPFRWERKGQGVCPRPGALPWRG